MTRRWVLLNPGPVNVSERVRRALLAPDLCHREAEFGSLLERIRKKILKIFKIEKTHTIALFTGSGTAALEAMLCSFADENKKILVLSNGVYGQRMRAILETYHRTPVITLSSPWGDFPPEKRIENLLKNDASIHAIAMVHHETSTGRLNPLARIGALAKKHKKIFLVDAVSSLGAEKIDFVKNGIGALAGTAGKCLHGFPGVSFVILSKKAVLLLKQKKPRSLYLDLLNTLQHQEKKDVPFTPAVQLFYAFHEALDELAQEGLSRRIRDYAGRSALLDSGFRKLGLRFLIDREHRSHVLTALWTPASISYEALHSRLKKHGFVIYAGQSELKGKIFRVAHLGCLGRQDLKNFIFHLARAIRWKKTPP